MLAPAREPAFWRAFFVVRGRVVPRTIPRGAAGTLEVGSALATAAAGETSFAPEDAQELLVVSGVLRRPPPEVRIVRLDGAEILAA